ncbi:hypothetical protein pb186bvf_010230 [Paramecium bursaria]
MEENEDSLSYSRFSKGSMSKLQTFVRKASDAISNQSSIKADGFKRAITGQSRRDNNSSLAISQLENMNATSFQLELTMNQNILDSQRELEEHNQYSIDENQELQDQINSQENTQNIVNEKQNWNKIKSFGQLATQLIRKKSSSHLSTFKKQISNVRLALQNSDQSLTQQKEQSNYQSLGIFKSGPLKQSSHQQDDNQILINQEDYLKQEDSDQEVPIYNHEIENYNNLGEQNNKSQEQLQIHEQNSITINENIKRKDKLAFQIQDNNQQIVIQDLQIPQEQYYNINEQDQVADNAKIQRDSNIQEQSQEKTQLEQDKNQENNNNSKHIQKFKKGIKLIIPLITKKAQKSLQSFQSSQKPQKQQLNANFDQTKNTEAQKVNYKVQPIQVESVYEPNIKIEDQYQTFNENEMITHSFNNDKNDDSIQNNQLNYSLQQQDDNQFQDVNSSKQTQQEQDKQMQQEQLQEQEQQQEQDDQYNEVQNTERNKLRQFKEFFQKAPSKILEKHQKLIRTLTQEISKVVYDKQERLNQPEENSIEKQNFTEQVDKQYREATQVETYSNEPNEFENESYDISYGVSKDPQQGEQIFDSQYVKDQYEQITIDLQQLQAEKKRLFNQPRKQANSQIPFKPNYKHLADIADDNEAIYRAKALVKKMNEQRKQHQQRVQRQNQKIDNYFKIDLSQLKNQQEQYIQRKEYTKKQSIQDRIDQYERKKREFLELQQVSQNFVRNLIHQGPQQGQLSKEVDDQAKQIKQSNQQIKLHGMIIKFPQIKRSSPKIDLQQKYEQIMSLRNDKLPLLRYK